MTWRDTVLKPKDIKFKVGWNPDDDTINLTIPLQALAECQAKRSFAAGVAEALVFIGEASKAGKQINHTLLRSQMRKWGLGDFDKGAK